MEPAKVLELTGVSGVIGAAQLAGFDINEGDRLLLKTKNSALWDRGSFSRESGDYFLICLPLKISGADGGPLGQRPRETELSYCTIHLAVRSA